MLGEEEWKGKDGWEQQYCQAYGSGMYPSMQGYHGTQYATMGEYEPFGWHGSHREVGRKDTRGSANVQIRSRKGEMRVVRHKAK
jgi:hypothetical protein